MSPVADSPMKVVPSIEPSPKKLRSDPLLDVPIKLQIAKLSENATIPTRGSARAAGYDLYSAEVRILSTNYLLHFLSPLSQDTEVPARGKGLVKTDIQIKVPSGTYGRIAPRSGLSWKNHIDIGAGVVDEDYRGNVGQFLQFLLLFFSPALTLPFHSGVVMFNHAETAFTVKKGDRIAQLVCERIYYPDIEVLDTLNETDRGEGGFGSTGTN